MAFALAEQWNTIETVLGHHLNFLEAHLKHQRNTHEVSLKYLRRIHKTGMNQRGDYNGEQSCLLGTPLEWYLGKP